MHPRALLSLPFLLLAPALAGCTIVSVDSKDAPPRIESRGLIDSHVALGIADEDHLLHFDLFDGTSDGAIGELVIWKLFRLEVGLAGASISLGPLHLGLGALLYDPEVPAVQQAREASYEEAAEEHEAAPADPDTAAEAGTP
jgi:hypothetical protein